MRPSSHRRPSAPLGAWLALGGGVVVLLALVLLGLWAWQQAVQIRTLQGEIQAQNAKQEADREQMALLQATVSALEEAAASNARAQWEVLESISGTLAAEGRLEEMQSSLAQVDSRIDLLEKALSEATTQVQSSEGRAEPAHDLPPSELRLSVPPQKQSHTLSCESAAAAMAAQYHGVPLTEAEVLAALPRADNPHLGFRGNVDGAPGGIEDYGVYAGPIIEILNGRGLRASLVKGGVEGIKAAVARGHPVIAWITYDCQASTPATRTIDGEAVSLVPYQHAVVVTGYGPEGVWANDPWDGRAELYADADFGTALAYFDDMAIEVAAP